MNIKQSLASTLAHAGEVVVALVLAIVVVKGLQFIGITLPTETMTFIGTIVINALMKFGRAWSGSPIPDYVNED